MSLRNVLKDLQRGSSTNSISSSSSSATSRNNSYSTSSRPLQGPCPAYHATISTSPHQEARSLHRHTQRDFLEETLGSDHECGGDLLPPYTLLCDGEKKPEYSRREETHAQADASRMDGALCLRCNMRKAKAWYLRTQKQRASR